MYPLQICWHIPKSNDPHHWSIIANDAEIYNLVSLYFSNLPLDFKWMQIIVNFTHSPNVVKINNEVLRYITFAISDLLYSPEKSSMPKNYGTIQL